MLSIRRTYRSLVTLLVLSLCVLEAFAADLNQRRHIQIVGSSTAYPIVASAAERFALQHAGPAPVVESTGTGGGIKLFCNGVGLETPDIVMASRLMADSERAACTANHVNDIREIKIGYDGIVIANSKAAPRFSLSERDLYLALAREVPAPDGSGGLSANPYTSWRQVNPELPDIPIRVLGPPPTSGTRDILVERILGTACLEVPLLRALSQGDPALFRQRCHALREDGAFVDAGENDARLVRKLVDDHGALGIFGYNFLDRNRDILQAARIGGIEPRFHLIESGVYPLARPLFIYVKPRHASVVRGLRDFVELLVSDEMSGPEGYLVDRGLIPLPATERESG